MSKRKLATVETILAIDPIEGADAIECATVRGWKVVVSKGEFTVGQKVIYFEIDSYLDTRSPYFAFLAARGTRKMNDPDDPSLSINYGHALKTIKLRGQISQGLVLDAAEFDMENEEDGTDVTDAFGVLKYEPYFNYSTGQRQISTFPTKYAQKSDAERVQNLGKVFDKLKAIPGWVSTVKLDGCLHRTTPIKMWDGSRKFICDIVPGDIVLGFDHKTNSVCPSTVVNAGITGKTDTWYRIMGKKFGVGAGGGVFSVKATENHEFWVTGKGYVRADNLEIGDELLCNHSIITPTLTQESIILGLILGDGWRTSSGAVAHSHSEKQSDYHKWINDALGPIVRGTSYVTSGYGSKMEATTLAVMHGLDLSGWDKPNGVVPKSIIDKINPIVMAFWYMDDGSLSHSDKQEDRITLSTYSFNEESHFILLYALEKMGIYGKIQSSEKGNTIRIDAEYADLFFSYVAPYIPPSMQYKLPTYYRGNSGWIPSHTEGYRIKIQPVIISEIQKDYHYMGKCRNGDIKPMQQQKWDIETTTHNFFAADILVHNSSITFFKDEEGTFRMASRNFEVDIDSDHPAAQWVKRTDLESLLFPGEAVQGEFCGPGIQGNKMGLETHNYYIFNVFQNGNHVPMNQWPESLFLYKIPVLHIEEFPNSIEEALSQASTIVYLNGYPAEGIVWHNDSEEVYKILGRYCWKAISDKFLLKDKG